jgi:dienelactone hydrolase
MKREHSTLRIVLLLYFSFSFVFTFDLLTSVSYGEESQWREYFTRRTAALRDACLTQKPKEQSWPAYQQVLRRELYDMLGLCPIPEKTELNPVVTRQLERDGIIVENIHFQSRPGLYVTGNLYRPSDSDKPLPGILYVCGHGEVKRNGIAYGNKTHYQHHGAWLARNGYVCLTIDTLQLGEIEGIHHGTHRFDMWWWLNRGYTPAGVEAWNSIRAIDYLVSRPEVDAERLGVTGRSGGGAYSWWLAALDERIDCAIPVAGITDLQDHVVDDCVQGHCDCMYFVNRYGWDYPAVAALVAPRPLLISNTDRDPIFPLEGVSRIHARVREVYRDFGKAPLLGLNITAGEHVDTQELQVHALRWLNAHLKNDLTPIPNAAAKLFEVEELKVFQELPSDQRNTTVHEWFVEEAKPLLPPLDIASRQAWKDSQYDSLRNSAFRCWPSDPTESKVKLKSLKTLQINAQSFDFQAGTITTDESFDLPLLVLTPSDVKAVKQTRVVVLDSDSYATVSPWLNDIASSASQNKKRDEALATPVLKRAFADLPDDSAVVLFVPRGIGPTSWPGDKKSITHFHRRLYLLGETLDALQTYDIASTLTTIQKIPELTDSSLIAFAEGVMATNLLYAAAISESPINLDMPPISNDFRAGPYYLNIQRKDSPH